MKKRKMKLLALAAAATMLVGAFPGTAMAATSDRWSVDYAKGAPTTAADPVDYAQVEYCSLGFNCYSTISGSSDKKITVYATNCAGFKDASSKSMKTSGKYGPWYAKNEVNGSVKFKFVASASVNCSGNGSIQQNK